MKLIRCFDVLLSAIGLLLALPVLLLLVLIGWFDTGSPLFLQQRVGRWQRPFTLVKLRTMRVDTPDVATHLASRAAVTRWGAMLRHYKLDELPQLWNVLKGEMSLVGPRPCLFNQTELITEREQRGVLEHRPGITGLAQLQGVDMSVPKRLAEIDQQMMQQLSLSAYFRYIWQTAVGGGRGDPAQ